MQETPRLIVALVHSIEGLFYVLYNFFWFAPVVAGLVFSYKLLRNTRAIEIEEQARTRKLLLRRYMKNYFWTLLFMLGPIQFFLYYNDVSDRKTAGPCINYTSPIDEGKYSAEVCTVKGKRSNTATTWKEPAEATSLLRIYSGQTGEMIYEKFVPQIEKGLAWSSNEVWAIGQRGTYVDLAPSVLDQLTAKIP